MLLTTKNLDVMRQFIPLEQACLSRPAVRLVVYEISRSVRNTSKEAVHT